MIPVVQRTGQSKATCIRILVAGLLTLTACLLYIDRFAVGIASESIRADLGMTQTQMSWFLSAFFWSYALCQVGAGWLGDRFGPRKILTVYIVGWSLFTGLLGLCSLVWQVLLLRLLCGAFQAGAYPVSSGLIRRWFPLEGRGTASSVVSLGGRFGAVLASVLTAALITHLHMGWRGVLMAYGIAGILVALGYFWGTRDRPEQHPACNEAERDVITGGGKTLAEAASDARATFPWSAALTSLSLWGNNLQQFFTNIGWLFVVTWLPRYLGDVYKVSLTEQSWMTAVPTIAGILGMFFGGWWTDLATRRLGPKWGRRLPIVTSRFVAAMGYSLCLLIGTLQFDPTQRWVPWMIILGLSLATCCCDMGVPAVWAYAQDVGGKYTASIMGWSNMFGNIGAAVAPLVYNFVLGESPSVTQWNSLFAVCAGMFLLASCAGCVIDSTKRIHQEKRDLDYELPHAANMTWQEEPTKV